MRKLIKKWSATVNDGHLRVINRDGLGEYIRQFEGRHVVVTIAPVEWQRSIPQNSYYWGVVLDTAGLELGYTKEEMHERWAYMFLRVQDDRGFYRVRSTTELTTSEFEEYLDKIKGFCSRELGIYIPDPNEVEVREYAGV